MKFTYSLFVVVCLVLNVSCRNEGKINAETSDHRISGYGDFEFTNELVHETSPYLLQHSHNPVQWKPWTNVAFETAKKENRLVALSIGYSTCHWCHVMEDESFEDVEVATLMNEKFISIKVDREERPDVDMVYQTALQLVNGTGGWPMNAILLPDGSPVYLGTYHTKDEWKSVLTKFSGEFEQNPDKMREYATMLANGVQEVYEQPGKQTESTVTYDKIVNGVTNWSKSWDLKLGGNKGQQKFIGPANLNFLLDYSILQQDDKARAHVLNTLGKVSKGGIYDHVGGGFFRYSTDAEWKVPHFEKMLYDNAQMMGLLSKAYRIFDKREYQSIVKETFQFLRSEMRNENGGYFSAMDADTNGEEGIYYIWSKEELKILLNEDFDLFSKFYGITENKVWENGSYVLSTMYSIADFSKKEGIPETDLYTKIEMWKTILYAQRTKRDTPSKDYKIITSWNALLIEGLLEAYKAFGEEAYLTEAKSVFEFLETHNYENGQLVHTYTTNSKQKEVFLEDYALLAKSALGLFEVTLELRYLELAKELTESADIKYSSDSGLYYYNATGTDMIPRIINTTDGVVPSANAIMAQNLFKLGHLGYNTDQLKASASMASLLMKEFENQAVSYSTWGSILLNQAYPYYEIAIVGENAKGLITELNSHYLTNTLVVGSSTNSNIALFKDRFFTDGTLIYVCQDKTCKLPVRTVKEALEQMKTFGYKHWNSKMFDESF